MNGSIFWTRARSSWQEDSKIFGDHKVISIPCIQTFPMAIPTVLPSCSNIIVTSQKTIDYAQKSEHLMKLLGQATVHTFGKKTAKSLESYCLSLVQYDVKSGEELLEILAKNLKGNEVLYLGPESPATEILPPLQKYGLKAHSLALYKTGLPEKATTLPTPLSGVICFASPSAINNFQIISENSTNEYLWAVTIGETTAKVAKEYFTTVSTIEKPDLKLLFQQALRMKKDWEESIGSS